MTKYAVCRCGGLKTDGKCDTCRNKATARKTTKERGYGHDWRKLSERIRKEQALCELCLDEGRTRPAEHVHHVATVATSPELRLARSNLVPICVECHRKEHETDDVSK